MSATILHKLIPNSLSNTSCSFGSSNGSSDEDSIFFLAIEYIENGTLERYISANLTEQRCKKRCLADGD